MAGLAFGPRSGAIVSVLYELINFAKAPAYRPDLSLNAQLAHSHYLFRPSEEYVLINGSEYCSVVGLKYPPPSSLAMYLRRFYELHFPWCFGNRLGSPEEKLYKEQDFIPRSPWRFPPSTEKSEVCRRGKEFRNRIENDKELPLWWHFSILVERRIGKRCEPAGPR